MSKIKKLEHQAFQLITESGLKGVLQSEIWKTLESTSQEGSRITLKLEKKSLIKRKRELYNGRWTDRIFSKRRPVEINSIIDAKHFAEILLDKLSPKRKIVEDYLGISQ